MNIGTRYLLDAVSINRLNLDILASVFVQTNCFMPEEIYHEVGSKRKRRIIAGLREKPCLELLRSIEALLSDIGVDNKVLDLYRNEGNGDIVLVSTVLQKRETEAMALFKTDWVIVSDDKDLQRLSNRKNIKAMATEKFIELFNTDV